MKFMCNATVYAEGRETATSVAEGTTLESREFNSLTQMVNWVETLEKEGKLYECPTFFRRVKGGWARALVQGWND
jgi:hypothetical protein